MGFKGSIYVCDVCGKEALNDGFPKDWFDVEIVRGDYGVRGNLLLDQSLCSEKCLRDALQNFLNRSIHYGTSVSTGL